MDSTPVERGTTGLVRKLIDVLEAHTADFGEDNGQFK